MNSEYKDRGDNSENSVTQNCNPGVAVYENT